MLYCERTVISLLFLVPCCRHTIAPHVKDFQLHRTLSQPFTKVSGESAADKVPVRPASSVRKKRSRSYRYEDFGLPSKNFKCGDSETQVLKKYMCDGALDCPNGEDEADDICNSLGGCPRDHRRCPGNRKGCVTMFWFCDGVWDCANGKDEKYPYCPGEPDPPEQTTVPQTTTPTVTTVQDTSSGSLNSTGTCWNLGIPCLDGNECIPKEWWCDGEADCVDESDEADCSTTTTNLQEPDDRTTKRPVSSSATSRPGARSTYGANTRRYTRRPPELGPNTPPTFYFGF